MNATGAAGMNKTVVNSVLNLVKNTNATSFAAHNIINATKNTTASRITKLRRDIIVWRISGRMTTKNQIFRGYYYRLFS